MALNHKGTVDLRAEGLLLRAFQKRDAESVFENWAGDDLVTRFLSWPTHEDEAASLKVISYWLPQYKNLNYYNWLIEFEGKPVGSIAIVDMDEDLHSAEIGYCLGRAYWGRGITTRALRAVIGFCFEQVGFNRVFAKHASGNEGSGRVMQKAGMRYEGTLRKTKRCKDGSLRDLLYYSILKSEYEK